MNNTQVSSHCKVIVLSFIMFCLMISPLLAEPVVLGYYPNWDGNNPPSSINYDLYTHLCHAFANPDENGHLKVSGNMPSAELITLAHQKNVKVLLSLGGYQSTSHFAKVTADVHSRDKFVSETLSFVKEHGYDGIDLDWEFPNTTQTMQAYTCLIDSYRTGLDSLENGKQKVLCAALSGTAWNSKYVDLKAVAAKVDFINVMTYDGHGGWSQHSGHNAPLYPSDSDTTFCQKATVDAMMTYMENEGIPPQKLLLGFPLYAREFVSSGLGKEVDPKKAIYDYISYKNIPLYIEEGWTYHWDESAHVPWLSSCTNDRVISYDDVRSTRDKANYAKRKHYRGIFFWEITQDLIDKKNVLVKVARDEFLK